MKGIWLTSMMIVLATRGMTILSMGLLLSCASSDCEKRSLASIDSPDARYSLVAYTLDCGATTATATHVALETQGSEAIDVFVTDGESSKVRIQWLGERDVVIKHGSGRVFKEEKAWNDVAIKYSVGG